MFSRSTVLVTGGAGYVGARLVPRLLAAGHRVRILDRFLYGEEPLQPLFGHAHLQCLRADVRDADAVARGVAGCDRVVHLAAISDGASFDLDPTLARSINLEGLAIVAEQARRAAVAGIVHLTSTAVEGAGTGPEGHGALRPVTALGRCEAKCEELAFERTGHGLAVATLRTGPLAGWSPRMRFDLPLTARAVQEFFQRDTPQVSTENSSGSLHVDDLVDLLVQIVHWPADVCGGSLFRVVGAPAAPALSADRPDGTPDLGLSRSFGWRPRRTAQAAVDELIERLGRGEFSDALTNPRYSNAESLRRLDRGELRRAA